MNTINGQKRRARASEYLAANLTDAEKRMMAECRQSNISYFDDYTPGVKMFTPEMGERKPTCKMRASSAHYGKHVFIDTPEVLKGRGIKFRKVYRAEELTKAGQYMVGWNSYIVTNRAFEILKAKYPIAMEMHLD